MIYITMADLRNKVFTGVREFFSRNARRHIFFRKGDTALRKMIRRKGSA